MNHHLVGLDPATRTLAALALLAWAVSIALRFLRDCRRPGPG